jgi:exportin-1
MDHQFESLRDVDTPFDDLRISLLNTLVGAIYTGSAAERAYANQLLTSIKEDPRAWARCEEILLSAKASLNTKFFALSIYDATTATRWLELPREKLLATVLEMIKTFAARGVAEEKPLLRKLDKVFVNAVRNEWLTGSEMWKSVIPQLANLSGSDQNLWENTMTILCMLSEDIFDFGSNTMTSRRVEILKSTLSEQFPHVQQLCELVLTQYLQSPSGTVKPSLVNAALSTMSHYLKWVPPATLFNSNFVDTVIAKFWDPLAFRIETVKCLTEALSVPVSSEDPSQLAIASMYQERLCRWIQATGEKMNNLPRAIIIERKAPSSSERLFYETFFNQISLMFFGLIKANMNVLNRPDMQTVTCQIMQILVRITDISGDEGFKSFVSMWLVLTETLMQSARRFLNRQSPPVESGDAGSDILLQFSAPPSPDPSTVTPQTVSSYIPVLGELAKVLSIHMAQPPEVTISETEDGEIERADAKETAEVDLYQSMSKCLQNITYIDRSLTEGPLLAMLKELSASVRTSTAQGGQWNSVLLSKITWAAGSIAGVTPSGDAEVEERRFTYEIIRELLALCNMHNSKTNRAIVASNVLFYCARHHRFLRANHKFLRTVYKKLFEFMMEPTPGVKEMASDTFLVISRSCAHKLVDTVAEGGSTYSPFIDSLVPEIQNFIKPLEPLQKCTIFEAIGLIISAVPATDLARQELLCHGFLAPLLEKWVRILAAANSNTAVLFELEVTRELSLFLRLFERVSLGIGRGIVVEKIVVQIYPDMLRLYKVYSETVAKGASQNMASWEAFKLMRKVKGDILRLISTFVEVSVKPKGMKPDAAQIHSVAANIIPRLLEYVLEDYRTAKPAARDFEVLQLLSSLCRNLSDSIGPAVGTVYDKMYGSTQEMIGQDPRAFPDHRIAFYDFLKNLTGNCFGSLLAFLVQSDRLGGFLETIVAGVQNEHPQIADIGLATLNQFLDSLGRMNPQDYGPIYVRIYGPLTSVVLSVMTDKLHDSGKETQIKILVHLLSVVVSRVLEPALTIVQAQADMNVVISQIGPNIPAAQREGFVKMLFESARDQERFRRLMNDLKVIVCSGSCSLDI